MPKTIEERERRLGVPPIRESYGEMRKTKETEEKVIQMERKKEEKLNEHMQHDKIKGYAKDLPPAKNTVMSERPPFKKK